MTTTFSSLSLPAHRQWFLSQVLTASGTMSQVVALSWLGWQLMHSGVDLGLLTTCALAPRLLIVTQSLYIALSSVLALVTALGVARLWHIFLLAFLSGVAGTPGTAARQVYANDFGASGGSRVRST